MPFRIVTIRICENKWSKLDSKMKRMSFFAPYAYHRHRI